MTQQGRAIAAAVTFCPKYSYLPFCVVVLGPVMTKSSRGAEMKSMIQANQKGEDDCET